MPRNLRDACAQIFGVERVRKAVSFGDEEIGQNENGDTCGDGKEIYYFLFRGLFCPRKFSFFLFHK